MTAPISANQPSPQQLAALLLSQDLFFTSKITGTAGALGYRVDVVGGPGQIAGKLADASYGCVMIDLALAGVAVADVVAALPDEDRPPIVAFGSHVNTTRLDEARDAGCDDVMPRSRFSAALPEILTQYLGN